MEKKIKLQDIKIDLLEKEEALNFVKNAILNKTSCQIVTLNPEMVIKAQKDKYFKNILNDCELTIADGVGIKIALKMKGISINQTRGIDFSRALLKLAEENNFEVAFIGTREDILNEAIRNIKEEFKNLNIVYVQNGFFDDEEEVIKGLKEEQPKILFTALGSPKQEYFNNKIKKILPNCVAIGVGGSFDVWANAVDEAPILFQKMGLEWLYRTVKEPKRFKRIFPTLPIFLFKSIIDRRKK